MPRHKSLPIKTFGYTSVAHPNCFSFLEKKKKENLGLLNSIGKLGYPNAEDGGTF